MTVGRVSQAAAEVLVQFGPTACLTQQATEVLLQQTPRARFGQQAVEVLRSVAMTGPASSGIRPVLIFCTCP